MKDLPVVRIEQFAPALADVPANLDHMLAAADEAARDGVDLLVFPELALTGYGLKDHVPGVALGLDAQELQALARASKNVSLAFGFVEETADHLFFNSAAYFEAGELLHVHRKIYLPTYGLFEEGRLFAPGESVRAFDTRFGRLAMLVCEDLWHLPLPYLAALDGAIGLLALSAGPTRGLDHEGHAKSASAWERLLLTYASSLTMYVVYANRVGFEDGVGFWGGSEILDPAGRVVVKGRTHEPDSPTAGIDLDLVRRERIQTPILRDERLPLVIAELARIQEKRRDPLPAAEKKA